MAPTQARCPTTLTYKLVYGRCILRGDDDAGFTGIARVRQRHGGGVVDDDERRKGVGCLSKSR
jgi:hypothetical protein